MLYRDATIEDIKAIQEIRHSVKENVLSDPALVTDADCEEYITKRGKGWVCETDKRIVAFAIADLMDHNIWALFVHPMYECRGIGKQPHHMMLSWYFSHTQETVWLSTGAHTRAEKFYRLAGWRDCGKYGKMK